MPHLRIEQPDDAAAGCTTVGPPADDSPTVVLAVNEDGLRFARKYGLTEFDRYLLPGDTIPCIELRRTA